MAEHLLRISIEELQLIRFKLGESVEEMNVSHVEEWIKDNQEHFPNGPLRKHLENLAAAIKFFSTKGNGVAKGINGVEFLIRLDK